MATKQILRQNSVNCDKSDLSAMWKKKFCTWQFFLHRHCLWCLWQIWGMIKFRQSEKYNYQMIKHWKNSRRLGGVSSIWLWDVSPPLLQALTMQPRLKEVGFGLLCCCVYILLRHWIPFFINATKSSHTAPKARRCGVWFVTFHRSSSRYVHSFTTINATETNSHNSALLNYTSILNATYATRRNSRNLM